MAYCGDLDDVINYNWITITVVIDSSLFIILWSV